MSRSRSPSYGYQAIPRPGDAPPLDGGHDESDSDERTTLLTSTHSSRRSSFVEAEPEYVQSQGVTRMEAIHRAVNHHRTGRRTLWLIGASVIVCAWAYSLDMATTSNYSPLAASSFGQHSSGLPALSIATNVIGAVCKPFIAKTSDITSRPYTYILILCFYVVGYITVALSPTINFYVAGEVLVAIGSSGLDLMNEVIVADLTTLEWRAFVGSMLSTPFLINTWFAGRIVDAFSTGERWRWGYGMFAIIMPVVLAPAIATLIHLDREAQREGIVNIASSNAARRAAHAVDPESSDVPRGLAVAKLVEEQPTWWEQTRKNMIEIDALGLLMLGFGWAMVLLPFVLNSKMKEGWNSPRMIIMEIFGVSSLAGYVIYEAYYSPMPSAPRRLLTNRTFISAIIIDFVYMLCGFLRSVYFPSYVLIVKTWSTRNWVYFNNTTTFSLCIAGLIAGLIQRWTHRYKTLQIIGLVVKMGGIGVLLAGTRASSSTASLISSQILIGAGGACSVVGSRVASQASVPHQDLALTAALLALCTKIGAAIGAAAAAMVWTHKMPGYMRQYMPEYVTDEEITRFLGNIKLIRDYDIDDPIRQGAIAAYRETLWYLITPALVLSIIPLFAACFQMNFYLGKQQNAVMNVAPDGSRLEDRASEEERARSRSIPRSRGHRTLKQKLLEFWAGKK
ncbi:major facilitator superfamily domain-containing protein [Schizophyllum amplum]|uniref:Major facilitator superfamily domain-containing protein n=1 Tax=Schizophyllum amplum TaxID=97359 RepID=A0A550CJL4_9AGAR|nr:major facilitator superfamily domain-containing protein [Auriculariopsis ampla]